MRKGHNEKALHQQVCPLRRAADGLAFVSASIVISALLCPLANGRLGAVRRMTNRCQHSLNEAEPQTQVPTNAPSTHTAKPGRVRNHQGQGRELCGVEQKDREEQILGCLQQSRTSQRGS